MERLEIAMLKDLRKTYYINKRDNRIIKSTKSYIYSPSFSDISISK